MITRRTGLAMLAAWASAPAWGQTADGPPLPPPLDELRSLPMRTFEGVETTLGAHLATGPAVITFWATWCSPCIEEARHLAALRTRTPMEHLTILGLNVDKNRDPKRLERFMKRGRMNYPQLFGNTAAYIAFGGSAPDNRITLPRLYVFDRNGAPAAAFGRYDGKSSLRKIDAAIARVL